MINITYGPDDDLGDDEYLDLDDVDTHGGYGPGSYFQHAMENDD